MKVHELPVDILFLVAPYLSPRDFLNFCSTCKDLQSSVRTDRIYWRNLTQSTFRLPNRPSDNRQFDFWINLYKQLSTKTDIYVWGQHQQARKLCAYPSENIFPLPKAEIPGVISDLQIGGWSSTLLNSQGQLSTLGYLDGDRFHAGDTDGVRRLFFDENETNSETTTIRSFSAGRKTVLGLSDNKTIWLWLDTETPGTKVQFPALTDATASKPSRVVAGWQNLSVYLPGTGIVVWPSPNIPAWQDPEPLPRLIEPKYQRVSNTWEDDITSHVILEKLIIFTTAAGHVYVSEYSDFDLEEDADPVVPDSYRIPDLENATEVQGSFRSFGIFNSEGGIFIGSQEQIIRWLGQTEEAIAWNIIPALQKTGAIQLAFGDYHYHALHTDGSITSYGHSPNDCGALGLAALQGTTKGLEGQDFLMPHGFITGRRICFDPAQKAFIQEQESNDSQHVARRRGLRTDSRRRVPSAETYSTRGEMGEWMEQHLRDWHLWPKVAATNAGGLAPYFALSVAAGGWSSGALMLVNEDVAAKVAEESKNELPQGSISVKLPNGSVWNESGGPVAAWKKTPPAFNFDYTKAYDDTVFGVRGWKSAA
jgi:SCF-associated factor 1